MDHLKLSVYYYLETLFSFHLNPLLPWNMHGKILIFFIYLIILCGDCQSLKYQLQQPALLLLSVVTVFVVGMMFHPFNMHSFFSKQISMSWNGWYVFIEQIIAEIGQYMTGSQVHIMEMRKWILWKYWSGVVDPPPPPPLMRKSSYLGKYC